MKTSMLDYYKLVLSKVSFHPKLFWKEYKKALMHLSEDDSQELKGWIRLNYSLIRS